MTSAATVKKLLAQLYASSGREFERALIPLLRVRWRHLVGMSPMNSWDNRGIDHLAWTDGDGPGALDVVVQAKGFDVLEAELDQAQIDQCLKSIKKFRTSGVRAKVYLLVHNRSGRWVQGWDQVRTALKDIQDSGQVDDALLMTTKQLVEVAYARIVEDLEKLLIARTAGAIDGLRASVDLQVAERLVPVRHRELHASTHSLRLSSEPTEQITDLASLLAAVPPHRTAVLVGEAGYGKTTTMLRLAAEHRRPVLFADAALVDPNDSNLSGVLWSTALIDEVLADYGEEDRTVAQALAQAGLAHQLRRTNRPEPLTLLIDGLDESRAFSGPQGITALFNAVTKVAVPVVVSMRTEMWRTREAEFASAAQNAKVEGEPRRYRWIDEFELRPWTDDLIRRHAMSFALERTSPEHDRVLAFADEIGRDGFDRRYGDVPRRPLFLRFLLEAVAEGRLARPRPLELLLGWVEAKIRRDVLAPIERGGRGRVPLADGFESVEDTVHEAFRVMEAAATVMTVVVDDVLELLPAAALSDVLASEPRLRVAPDRMRVCLNSLLVPEETGLRRGQVRFAHRVLQEVFLARVLVAGSSGFGNPKLPDAVRAWVTSLRVEAGHALPEIEQVPS